METTQTIARVREFNREWTEVLGLLDRGLLDTDHSLAEARVLFELAQQQTWERSVLQERLGMDPSFLSRVLRRLENEGLVMSSPSAADRRALNLRLTNAGRDAFEVLNRRYSSQIADLLEPLTSGHLVSLTESMGVISNLVGREHEPRTVRLRSLEPGDLGWVVQRHGAVYADEFGWNDEFEALVARIVADYRENLKPDRENAWIAELDGARAGCIFCCQRDQETAQLRILLVEPWARGHGIGKQLVAACIEFARDAEYSKVILWTNDVLVSARKIYAAAGFQLTDEEEHHSFGQDLVGQTWELVL
jgi:DNA-binding MarR family transcriptional regulator/N-acetylglutamate synthase-like GNAT family acetyltransferase